MIIKLYSPITVEYGRTTNKQKKMNQSIEEQYYIKETHKHRVDLVTVRYPQGPLSPHYSFRL